MLTLEELYKSMLQRAVDGKDVKHVTNWRFKAHGLSGPSAGQTLGLACKTLSLSSDQAGLC